MCYNEENGDNMERVVVENVYIDGDPNGIVVSCMRMSPITAFVIPRNLLSVAKHY